MYVCLCVNVISKRSANDESPPYLRARRPTRTSASRRHGIQPDIRQPSPTPQPPPNLLAALALQIPGSVFSSLDADKSQTSDKQQVILRGSLPVCECGGIWSLETTDRNYWDSLVRLLFQRGFAAGFVLSFGESIGDSFEILSWERRACVWVTGSYWNLLQLEVKVVLIIAFGSKKYICN